MQRLFILAVIVLLLAFPAASAALAAPDEQGVALTPLGPVPVVGIGTLGGTTVALTPFGLAGATLLPPTALPAALSGPPINPAAVSLFNTYLSLTGGNPVLASYAANFYALTPMGQAYAAQAASAGQLQMAATATYAARTSDGSSTAALSAPPTTQ